MANPRAAASANESDNCAKKRKAKSRRERKILSDVEIHFLLTSENGLPILGGFAYDSLGREGEIKWHEIVQIGWAVFPGN